MIMTNIMLVDDEEPFVETMIKRLTKKGFTVIGAFSGYEALKTLASNRTIDIVILDVKMPGMDGIETLKEIKSKFPLVEVIMLTGHATVESAIEGMKLGAFDYLMKPSDMEQLLAKIEQAKDKKYKHEEKIREARIKELSYRFQ
ncbi:MAG: response regulator [Thermodesulfobacteriota bacterium]